MNLHIGTRARRALGVLPALVAAVGCTTVSMAPVDPPVREQVGPSVVRSGSGQLWAVVDYRFAAANLGSDWLIVHVAVTAADRSSARIERDDIFVRTPTGTRVPLPSQAEYLRVHAQLQSALRRADVAASPMWSFFPRNRRPCDFRFFADPGDVAYDSVEVNGSRACRERLVFEIPGGVQPGRWVIGIDAGESKLRIPFDLS